MSELENQVKMNHCKDVCSKLVDTIFNDNNPDFKEEKYWDKIHYIKEPESYYGYYLEEDGHESTDYLVIFGLEAVTLFDSEFYRILKVIGDSGKIVLDFKHLEKYLGIVGFTSGDPNPERGSYKIYRNRSLVWKNSCPPVVSTIISILDSDNSKFLDFLDSLHKFTRTMIYLRNRRLNKWEV